MAKRLLTRIVFGIPHLESSGGDSVLASLSRRDFEAGMEALRSHAAQVDSQAVLEPIDVFVFRCPPDITAKRWVLSG